MGNCLNFLAEPSVFITTATLLVIVLLVWAQLYARGEARKQERNVNWIIGLAWTYGAMLFALTAVAALPFNVNLAKGFLVLSFLMTVFSILSAVFRTLMLIFVPEGSIVDTGNTCCEKIKWSICWALLLVGLGILSFGFVSHCCCKCCGGVLAVLAVVYMFYRFFKARCSRKKKKEEEPEKRDETCLFFFYSCGSKKKENRRAKKK
jgi:hypothetical protein